MLSAIILSTLLGLKGLQATPIPLESATLSLHRRAHPTTMDRSIFFKPGGPSCNDIALELASTAILSPLCSLTRLNPGFLRSLVNHGQEPTGPNDEVTITIWRDEQPDEYNWLEPKLVKTDVVVRFSEAMSMVPEPEIAKYHAGGWNGAASRDSGWWPAAFEQAYLQAGFTEQGTDGTFKPVVTHHGMSAFTGKPAQMDFFDRANTPDAERPAADDRLWSILQTADRVPVVVACFHANAKTLENQAGYTVLSVREDEHGERFVALWDPVLGYLPEYKFSDILDDINQVGSLEDLAPLVAE